MIKRGYILVWLTIFAVFFTHSALAQEKIKIGVVQFSDEGFYAEGLRGVLQQLKKGGFNENDIIIDIKNAEGRKDKVLEIIKEFKGKGLNLIITIGTMPTIIAAEEIKDIPIVFSTVYDPIGSGIAKDWESSGNNTTGTSTWVDFSSMVSTIRRVSPGKKIGVIYTAGEKNSVIQLSEFNKLKDRFGYEVISVNLDNPDDAKNVTEALVGRVDSFFITGSTVVGKGLGKILEVAKRAKIPTFAHLQERAEQGVLIVVAANSFELGELAGKKATQVLNGVHPVFIPIETLEQFDITINLKTSKEMGLIIPQSLLAVAKKIIE